MSRSKRVQNIIAFIEKLIVPSGKGEGKPFKLRPFQKRFIQDVYGYDRLPGQGYEYYNPDLKGIHPEEYPDINKFEILSDVAYGSNEYHAANEKMSALYQSGEMSVEDMAKFDEIYTQNQERARKRIFHEYKNDNPDT